ncbi:MAG: trigger factor [Nitrospirae bacterium]|nr:MAG: trigger factor [Nitrospirota bacterium]
MRFIKFSGGQTVLKSCEDISSTKKRLQIEIPAEQIEAEIKKALQDLQRKAKMPGFRPGKTPMSMVEKKFGKEVEAEALDKLIPDHYISALKEANLTPVTKPEMESKFDFKRGEAISMTISVEVRPKVENLQYENITVKEVPVEVADAEIEDVINNLAEEKATFESSEEPIASGDLVTVDYTAIEDGGQEPTISKDAVFKIDNGPYPEEFFNVLKGKKKDEAFDMEVSFPDEPKTAFSGKKVKFDGTIKEAKKRSLPAIDDELAKDIGFESLQALRDKIKENLLAAKNREADAVKQREILDKLLETHSFDLPEGLVKAEVAQIVGDIKTAKKDERAEDVIAQEVHHDAERRVKGSLLLELVGEKEGVTVIEDDLKREVVSIAQRFYIAPDAVVKFYVDRDGSLDGLKRIIFEKKVLKALLDKAQTVKGEA